MFFNVKLKLVIAFFAVVLVAFFATYFLITGTVKAQSETVLDYTIVLDAGHGGMDGGSEGLVSGVKESDLNLQIVFKLQKYLQSFGFRVVLTRDSEEGLYNIFGRGYKQEDMANRKKIIQQSRANMVISIHLNSYPDKNLRGAQVFYEKGHESSQLLANTIQKQLFKNLPHAKQNSNLGDYYILKCTSNPSVMVECGFLTNAEEEVLLQTEEYQMAVAYEIFSGVVRFFAEIS